MKKYLILAAAAALLLAFVALSSGCGTQASGSSTELSSEKYAQLEDGMSVDQVKAIAGEPAKTESKKVSGGHAMEGMDMSEAMDVEYFYYQGSKGWVRLEMSDGKLTSKSGY
jgi:hypothetical protein